MVAFNDRRNKQYDSVDAVLSGIQAGPKDSFSKSLIDGRYLVHGVKNEDGRTFVVHEALANGDVVNRGQFESRKEARKATKNLPRTSVIDI
jgi:hypothetical protein